MNYNELRTAVIENGFNRSLVGMAADGEPVFFSAGISMVYKFTDADIQAALTSFIAGNYGGFYEHDETPTAGKEYGQYKSIFGKTTDTGAIVIHRERGALSVYFQFER